MKNEVYLNYIKSLKQKYHAVCFDIDGTLTVRESKKIDEKAIEMIIDLFKKKIPVVFITGRGESGLNDLKDDIYLNIINDEEITESDIKRMFVLTNDGARLFYSRSKEEKDFLNSNIYISTEEELKELLILNNIIETIIDNSKLSEYININYSKDLNTNKILNIRLIIENNNQEIVEEIFKKMENIIKDNNLSSINITRGVYKGKSVIQFGTASKDKAIERTEKLIGVPEKSMIRIGDCGDVKGNDYGMLNCSQGYSVDKTSGQANSCFPIFNNQGIILNGVDATIHLIKSAKILPTICLEKADKEIYKHHFAKVESNIVLGRNKLLKKYNDIICINFDNCNGIDDLFDKESGSIKIPMYELEFIDNNPLKEFWLSSKKDNLIYSIRDNNNYLLRGSSTYYYFISNRISIDNQDKTTKENIITWHKNYIEFLNNVEMSISETNNLEDITNKKMLLGILDNCRNILITLVNHHLVSKYKNQNILFDFSKESNMYYLRMYKNLLEMEKIISNICFTPNVKIDKNKILEEINNTKLIIEFNLKKELFQPEKEDYSKDYRAYREIDNFAENYIAVSLYKENASNNKTSNACGLSYGGIELPILAKIIDENRIEKALILKFNKEVSGYTNKQLIDLRTFDINEYGGIINSDIFQNTNIDIFDDNVLTGKTLQLAINSLYDYDISVNNICIVRYPSINRINQMFLNNPTAVDYNLFFDYIYGLCFNSPYSWKDNDWIRDNGIIDYTDSLGVFDINRRKIVECLLKNHDYSEESEVGEYKRRLTYENN